MYSDAIFTDSGVKTSPCTRALATIGPLAHFIQDVSPISIRPQGTGGRGGGPAP